MEDRRAAKPRTRYPCCIGGYGNCPPEDSGGPETWMWQRDETLGLDLDEDLAMALEFMQEISDTRSLAILDDPDQSEELQELLFKIKARSDFLGQPFEWRKVSERLRQDEHLNFMYQQI